MRHCRIVQNSDCREVKGLVESLIGHYGLALLLPLLGAVLARHLSQQLEARVFDTVTANII